MSHENPKRRRADDRYNDRSAHHLLNQFGEYDDIDTGNRTKSKSKPHQHLEFKCHVHNGGCNVTASPFRYRHSNSSIGTGSTAGTSKACEDSSMFESFGHEMRGMGDYVNDMSPVLSRPSPGSARKLKAHRAKATISTQYDISHDSPVSSISATSSPSISFVEGPSGIYNHESTSSVGRRELEASSCHSPQFNDTIAGVSPRSRHVPSDSPSTDKTAVQLFSLESPEQSQSPDSLDSDHPSRQPHPLFNGHHDSIAGSSSREGMLSSCPSAVVCLFATSPDLSAGSARRRRGEQSMQAGRCYLRSGGQCNGELETEHSSMGRRNQTTTTDDEFDHMDDFLSRVEQSADYISEEEEDGGNASSPSPALVQTQPHVHMSRTPGGTTRHRGTRIQRDEGVSRSSEDVFLQGTPGRLDFTAPRRRHSGTGNLPSGSTDGLGRLFGSGGEISPVSMNISFDSVATLSRDGALRSPVPLSSPTRCVGVGGHSLFRELIRAASTGAEVLSDDSDTCDDPPRTSPNGCIDTSIVRQNGDSSYDDNALPASASTSSQSPLGSWAPSRSDAASPAHSSSPLYLRGPHHGTNMSASDYRPSGSVVSRGRPAIPIHPHTKASPPPGGDRHMTGRSLTAIRPAAGTPIRPTHRRAQSSNGVPSRDILCATTDASSSSNAQHPVVHLGYSSTELSTTPASACASRAGAGGSVSSSLLGSHVRSASSPFEQMRTTPKAPYDKRPSSARAPKRSPGPTFVDQRWANGRSRSTSFHEVGTSPPSHAGHNQAEEGVSSGGGLAMSPSRFMEQRHCSRAPSERTSNDAAIGGADEGSLWLGGSKRSRSPRCVSPRYGSTVVTPQDQSDSNDCAITRGGVEGNDAEEPSCSYGFSRPFDVSYASSLDSTSNRRPLPDQSAFDPSHLNTSTHSAASHASPVCPPTPDRVPHWLHDASAHPCDGDGVEQGGGSAPSGNIFGSSMDGMKPPPMRRLNSLVDTKILLSSVSSDHERTGGSEGGGNVSSEQPSHSTDGGSDDGHNSGEATGHGGVSNVMFYRDFVNEGLMGSGTFAEVFRVSLKADPQQTYAVKKSRRQFRSRKDRENLLNEVRIMQVVGAESCPHIIQFYRAWQEDSFFYVQLELAERGTLKDLMVVFADQRKRLSDTTIMRIIHDVAAGLEHIHACHVVHLDIKPANILIGLDGTLKIGDFGIAMLEGGGADEAHEGDTRYLPEELLNSSERHPSADVFSLGLTLYEVCLVPELDMLPYGGSLWHDLREGRAVDLSVPTQGGRQEDLCAVIAACMSPHPDNRPSAADILHHPCVTSLDLSQPCLALCGANVRAPSPVIFRTNSFCPIGPSGGDYGDPSGGLSVGAACSRETDDDSGRLLSTPLMGASHMSKFFRMLSPPNVTNLAAGPYASGMYELDSYASSPLGAADNDDMEEEHAHGNRAHGQNPEDSNSSNSGTENCSTPSTHTDTPNGPGSFWSLRATTPQAHNSGPTSAAAPPTTTRSIDTPSVPLSTQPSFTPSDRSGGSVPAPPPLHRPAGSPRTNSKKKLSGGRPHGSIRKVKK